MERIGRYLITGELGRGAMGLVYRAQDPAIGRTVAIKTIRLADVADAAERGRLRERLFREARSAGILSHPGIVTIYDMAEQGDLAYLAMEFVNGPTLDEILSRPEPIPPSAFLDILAQTAAALDYAHKRGIVHRDIKPANIMIHEGGTAKITDFGVAKTLSQQMTQAGAMLGTPNYMSPEQVKGEAVDGRADQFALGVVAYEALTGEKPFASDDLPALLYKIVRDDPPPPQRLNPSLGTEIERVLRKALAKTREDRYATCTDFVEALASACDATPGWRTMPRGASHELPTVAGEAAAAPDGETEPAARVTAPRLVLPPPRRRRRPGETDEPAQGRGKGVWIKVAAVIAGFGVVILLTSAGFIWLTERETPSAGPPAAVAGSPQPPPPEAKTPPAPEPAPETAGTAEPVEEVRKPSPMAPPVLKPATAPKEPAELVEVEARTIPPGCSLLFDNDPLTKCTSPCRIRLAPGRHTVLSTLEGYRNGLRVFEVPRETTVIVDMQRLSGTVLVVSNPPGASILVNGERRYETTPASFRLPVGKYTVAVTKEGYKQDAESIDVRDGAILRLEFSLGAAVAR